MSQPGFQRYECFPPEAVGEGIYVIFISIPSDDMDANSQAVAFVSGA